MTTYTSRFISLVFGLFLYAVGIVLTLKANIGYAPWDVFHAGVVNHVGISFGSVSILVGLIIVAISVLLGEKIGVGTVCNIVLIGYFIDLLLSFNLPLAPNVTVGFFVQALGLFVVATATYYYVRAGFGVGPRDSLMVMINRRTGISIGISRAIVEFSVALIGWRLGGLLGVGTLFSALIISTMVQIVFNFFKFKPAEVQHESIQQTVDHLFSRR